MMADVKTLLEQFHDIAANPKKQKEKYLAEGKKIVLCAPVMTPEEIIHSMGMVPMGAWGADMQVNEAKKYFPAFICNIVQSIVELGIKGTYDGCTAIVIPSLSDGLKVLGQNFKVAVPQVKFIPMTYPQNRKPEYGHTFTKVGYERVIRDLEEASGLSFDEEKLAASIKVYNEHNRVMREVVTAVAAHPEITCSDRSAIFKSAFFMTKEEHTEMVKALLEALGEGDAAKTPLRIMTSGLIADAPGLLSILDDCNFHVVCDDMAAESRQYKWDAPEDKPALDALVDKFCGIDGDAFLFDPEKKRVPMIVSEAKKANAQGLLMILSKFVDTEEFDYPLVRRAAEAEGIRVAMIEIDRTMVDYEQARTAIETFRDLLAE